MFNNGLLEEGKKFQDFLKKLLLRPGHSSRVSNTACKDSNCHLICFPYSAQLRTPPPPVATLVMKKDGDGHCTMVSASMRRPPFAAATATRAVTAQSHHQLKQPNAYNRFVLGKCWIWFCLPHCEYLYNSQRCALLASRALTLYHIREN